MRISDWSSDVCSSDLGEGALDVDRPHRAGNQQHRGAGQCDDVGAYLVPDQRRDDRGEDEQGQDLVDRHVRPASRTRRRVVNAPGYDSTFGSTTRTPRAAIRAGARGRICDQVFMREPSVRASRLAIAGGAAATIVIGAVGFFLGRATYPTPEPINPVEIGRAHV